MVTKYFFKNKMAARFLFWFLIVGLVPLLTFSYLSFSHIEKTIKVEMINSLVALTEHKEAKIDAYLTEKERDITTFTHTPGAIRALERFTEAYGK